MTSDVYGHRPISDNDALLAANLIADEQYQQVSSTPSNREDGGVLQDG